MNGVTPEQIEKAKEIDLLSYLMEQEPYELVRINNNTYTTRTHDSLKISNGAWMWFSRGFGGYTALDYLIKVKGLSFVESVKILNRQGSVSISRTPAFSLEKKQERKLLLPEKSQSNEKITGYLKSRKIDPEIIGYCIKENILYESENYGNAVFVGYDDLKVARYASYRSTNGTRILGDAAGSDKKYSFQIINPESENLHIFESAIDLLSYATLIKLNDMDWKKDSYLSLAGVYRPKSDGRSKIPATISRVLSQNKKVRVLKLHLDNDAAGRAATEGLKKAVENMIRVVDEPPPFGKDYNDYLCCIVNEKSSYTERRRIENERER